MTVTYAVDTGEIWRTLFTWLETYAVLPVNSILRLNQVAGRPALPYGTMQVLSDIGVGIDGIEEILDVATDKLRSVTYGPRRLTLQCGVYTAPEISPDDTNAMIKLTGAIQAIRTPPAKVLFGASGLAFLSQLNSVQAVDEQLGQRWERRATVDLEFGYTAYTTVIPDVADLDGNYLVSVEPINEVTGNLILQE